VAQAGTASEAAAQTLSDQELAAQADMASESSRDVNFRPQGERGMGGPIYGDVLCADGVYLPHVWEMDMHTSYDGRWLRTGFYDSEAAHLVDRKSRRSWVISKPEGELLDAIHWRMPRWSGESINESGIADDAHVIMSDASFEAWLGEHMAAQPQPLLQVVDLWVPADCLPAEVARPMPTLPQPAQPSPVPPVLLQRHWPASLRKLRYPMAPLQNPHWQLMLGEPPSPGCWTRATAWSGVPMPRPLRSMPTPPRAMPARPACGWPSGPWSEAGSNGRS
jgi:hypothetical protein